MDKEYIKTYIKKFHCNITKTVTCNISVSESSQCMMEVDKEVLDVPVEIGRKLSRTSLENSTWHTDVDKTVYNCNVI